MSVSLCYDKWMASFQPDKMSSRNIGRSQVFSSIYSYWNGVVHVSTTAQRHKSHVLSVLSNNKSLREVFIWNKPARVPGLARPAGLIFIPCLHENFSLWSQLKLDRLWHWSCSYMDLSFCGNLRHAKNKWYHNDNGSIVIILSKVNAIISCENWRLQGMQRRLRRSKRGCWVKAGKQINGDMTNGTAPEECWTKNFRMSKESFKELERELQPWLIKFSAISESNDIAFLSLFVASSLLKFWQKLLTPPSCIKTYTRGSEHAHIAISQPGQSRLCGKITSPATRDLDHSKREHKI